MGLVLYDEYFTVRLTIDMSMQFMVSTDCDDSHCDLDVDHTPNFKPHTPQHFREAMGYTLLLTVKGNGRHLIDHTV